MGISSSAFWQITIYKGKTSLFLYVFIDQKKCQLTFQQSTLFLKHLLPYISAQTEMSAERMNLQSFSL